MKKVTERQLILYVFCGGVLLGTVLANVLPKLYLPAAAELLDELDGILRGPSAAYRGYFGYLMRVRLLPMLVIWLCLFGAYGAEGLCLSALWYGLCCGAVLSGAVLIYGIGGLFLFLAAIFPQYICYFLIFMQLINKFELKSRTRHGQALKLSEEIGFLLVIAVLFLAGVLLETYLNPIILRMAFLVV
ncbi:MAG: hypothetical protein IJZ85_01900 [Lachnospiraceae bacterium]|nr:hypothetical protein [Lachnospiraceae bacterium]